jgi:HK97 family phage major capsid protein
VTTPAIAAILKQKARFSNTDTPIWQGNILNGTIEGLRAVSSNQMTAGQLLAGDFSQVVVGEWGVLEVEANPYANFAAGIVGVRAFYTVDVGVRYPAAFSLGTGITA